MEIAGLERGVIEFTAEDENFKSWKIEYRQSGSTDFMDTGLKGKRQHPADDPASVVIGLDDLGLANGRTYEFRVTALDVAGNEGSDNCTMTYDKDGIYKRKAEPEFRIKRPSWREQDAGANLHFTVPMSQEAFTLEDENFQHADDLYWYIGESMAGRGGQGQISGLEDGDERSVAAFYDDADGRHFSCAVIENDEEEEVACEAAGTVSADAGGKRIVSFTVLDDTAGLSMGGRSLTAGNRYFVTDLTGHFSEESMNFHAAHAGSAQILLDTVNEETFTVSTLAEMVPVNASVKSRLNGRTYVYFDDLAAGEDVSYNIYHGTEEGFELNEESLAATG